MTNVGSAEFVLNVRGAEKAAKDTHEVQQQLVALDIAAQTSVASIDDLKEKVAKYNKITQAGIRRIKASSDVMKENARNIKSVTSAYKAMHTHSKKVIRDLADARRAMQANIILRRQAVNAARNARTGGRNTGFLAFAEREQDTRIQNAGKLRVATERAAAAQKKLNDDWKEALRINRRLTAERKKARTAQDRLNREHGQALEMNKKHSRVLRHTTTRMKATTAATKRLSFSMKANGNVGTSWLKRFTLIAGGFALAHLALRAFGDVVRSLTSTFTSGLTVADEYAEGVATIAGMVAITYKGLGGFAQRFEATSTVMQDTMAESIRLAPKFKLSLEEITAGYRELAQFGVIVTKSMVNSSLTVLNAIKEIAASTGSTIKQIRQEIQSMFNGSARVTDQFARMVKNTMPDVWAQIIDPAITAADKWKILTSRWEEFSYAIVRANQTVKGQLSILRVGFTKISLEALKGSGIFQLWVDKLIELNDRLFDSAGDLTALGESIKKSFEGIWNAVNNGINLLVELAKAIVSVRDLVMEINPTFVESAKRIAILASKMFVLTTALSLATVVIRTLAATTGLLAVAKGLRMIFMSTGFVAGVASVASVLGSVVLLLGAGIGVGYAFATAWETAIETVKQVWRSLIPPDVKLAIIEFWDLLMHPIDRDPGRLKGVRDSIAKEIAALEAGGDIRPPVDPEAIKKTFMDASASYIDGLKGLKDIFTDGFSVGLDPNNNFFQQVKEVGSKFSTILDGVAGKWNDLKNGVREVKKEYIDFWQIQRNDRMNIDGMTPPGADKDKNTGFVKNLGDTYVDSYKSMMERVSKSLKGTWDSLFKGDITRVGSLFDSVMDNMASSFQSAMSDMTEAYVNTFLKGIADAALTNDGIIGQISNVISSAFGGPTHIGLSSAQVAAQYGGVGQAVRGLATGGLISEKVFGVGESGRRYTFGEQGQERILSTAQTNAADRGGNVSVNITNNSSAQVRQSSSKPRFDGRQMIIDVLLEDYSSGGQTYQAFGGGR